MQWWDVYVQVPEHVAEVVSTYLWHAGSTGVVVYDRTALACGREIRLDSRARAATWTVLYGALPEDTTLPLRLCALQQFLDTCPHSSSGPLWKLSCRPSHEGYLTQWQQFFHPLCIEQRLVIHAPWATEAVPAGIESLLLDPGLAFGTGLHPTTHMCLRLLAQGIRPGQGGRLLDVGCGSGILSLAALKLGIDAAVGIDIDARAVRVAEQNATRNGLQDRTHFLKGSGVPLRQEAFLWIVANIYLGPLVEMMPTLAQRLMPQGSIILSGILERQEAALQASLQTAGLNLQQRLVEDGWVALKARHARSLSTSI
jgi:ribosomal protein L11 methyltransferase